jgi:magnesium-protoporphyrin O-methyltransferase
MTRSCGGHCCAIDENFDRKVAEAELARYRRRGASPSTRKLLKAIGEAGPAGPVLDVGGGIGVIAHELIAAGAPHATVVDVSAAFLAAARDEVERRRAADRLALVHGDFVALATEIAVADVVTLDKVVCCYPDMERLLDASASRARRLYGIVYPRDAWWVRLAVATQNAIRRARRKSFRVYVFPNAEIGRAIRRLGHSLVRRERGFVWVVELYERRDGLA